jgi:hypothetical protein
MATININTYIAQVANAWKNDLLNTNIIYAKIIGDFSYDEKVRFLTKNNCMISLSIT